MKKIVVLFSVLLLASSVYSQGAIPTAIPANVQAKVDAEKAKGQPLDEAAVEALINSVPATQRAAMREALKIAFPTQAAMIETKAMQMGVPNQPQRPGAGQPPAVPPSGTIIPLPGDVINSQSGGSPV